MVKHKITEEDMAAHPEWAAAGYKVGGFIMLGPLVVPKQAEYEEDDSTEPPKDKPIKPPAP